MKQMSIPKLIRILKKGGYSVVKGNDMFDRPLTFEEYMRAFEEAGYSWKKVRFNTYDNAKRTSIELFKAGHHVKGIFDFERHGQKVYVISFDVKKEEEE